MVDSGGQMILTPVLYLGRWLRKYRRRAGLGQRWPVALVCHWVDTYWVIFSLLCVFFFFGFVFLKKGVLLFFSMLALNIRKTGFLMFFFFFSFFKLATSSKAFLGFSSLSLR